MKVGANLTSPSLAINIVKTLESEVLRIQTVSDSNQNVKINPPYGISSSTALQIRLLSGEFHEGMVNICFLLLKRLFFFNSKLLRKY